MTNQPINIIASNYVLRRYTINLPPFGFTQFVPPNPSRWSIRFVGAGSMTQWITPFGDDPTFPGIRLDPGETIEFYLSREPSLVGSGWYIYNLSPSFDPVAAEAWECTPTGT